MTRSELRDLTARRVREELARQETTVPDLATKTGIPVSVLDERVAGRTAFDVDELDAIARALGVPVVALLSPVARGI